MEKDTELKSKKLKEVLQHQKEEQEEQFIEANGIKVVVNFLLSCTAMAVFLYAGAVDWRLGIPLLVANSLGGVLGAHLAVRHGDVWIRRLLVVVVVVSSVKLLFF